jgi:iron-sulfur cluster assembly protein CyaY
MDEREFIAKSDACLQRVARWLEDFDPDDLDYSTADGSVTVEFSDGTKFILSRQSATRQVWLAAGAHGYHFSYDSTRDTWVDDKDGRELYPRLAEAISQHLGREVTFD